MVSAGEFSLIEAFGAFGALICSSSRRCEVYPLWFTYIQGPWQRWEYERCVSYARAVESAR